MKKFLLAVPFFLSLLSYATAQDSADSPDIWPEDVCGLIKGAIGDYLYASDSLRKNGDEEGAQKLVGVSADYATIYDAVCKN